MNYDVSYKLCYYCYWFVRIDVGELHWNTYWQIFVRMLPRYLILNNKYVIILVIRDKMTIPMIIGSFPLIIGAAMVFVVDI